MSSAVLPNLPMTKEASGLTDTHRLGREAARLKWKAGKAWAEIFALWPDQKHAKIRSAARRWRNSHPDEYPPKAETPFGDIPQELGTEFEIDGNVAVAKSVSTQITTLEELLEVCQVDLEVWEVDDFTIRTYDGWRGGLEKEMRWEGGKIVEGYVKDGGIITRTLFSIFARLVRREPVPLEPTFSIISCPITFPPPRGARPGDHVRSLLFSDAQIGFWRDVQSGQLTPFHDRQMLDIIAQIAADYQPHLIGILGDLFDMTRFTRQYVHEPEFYWTTDPALKEGHWFLRRLREACPDAQIVYPEGNHEVRLPVYVRSHMIEACKIERISGQFPALSLPDLLDLDALQVEWIPGYDDDTAKFRPTTWMIWEHGQIARVPGQTAKAIVERAVRWRFSGHTHRCEIASKTFEENPDDERPPVSAVQFGCCCHTDGRVPGAAPGSQWQKRFGVVEFDVAEPPPTIEIIAVRKGKAIWRGRQYVGRDYSDQLRELWPEWGW